MEFRREPSGTNTILRVTESGFEKIPAHRIQEALRKNDGGWAQQMKAIENYVAQHP